MAGSRPSRIKVLADEPRAASGPSTEAAVDLRGLTSYRSEQESKQAGGCLIVFPQSAYRQVVTHLSEDTSREHGGFLLGYETWSEEARAAVVVVEHAIPAKFTSGTPVRLTFTKESWRNLDEITEKLSQNGHRPIRVGWYHSHPNISIFLSHWDLDVCKEFDRRQNPIALVVDPVNRRGGFFVREKSGYKPHSVLGFLERHDLQKESIVDWTNLTRSDNGGGIDSDRQTEGLPQDVDLMKLQKQLDEMSSRIGRASSRSRALAVTMLLAALLIAGSFYLLDRKIDREDANLQQESAQLRAQMTDLANAVVDFEHNQASHAQPANVDQSKQSVPEEAPKVMTPAKESTKIPPKPAKDNKHAAGAPTGDTGKGKGQEKDPKAGTLASHDSKATPPASGSTPPTPAGNGAKSDQSGKPDVFPDATKAAPTATTPQPPTNVSVPAVDSKPAGNDPKPDGDGAKPASSDPNNSAPAHPDGPSGASQDW